MRFLAKASYRIIFHDVHRIHDFLSFILDLKRQYQTLNETSDGRNNHSSDTSTDITGHVPGTNDGNVPGSAFHIGPNEDMGQVRLGQQGNYHVTNTTNKDW